MIGELIFGVINAFARFGTLLRINKSAKKESAELYQTKNLLIA